MSFTAISPSIGHVLSDLYNAIINIWGEISCHRHFKLTMACVTKADMNMYIFEMTITTQNVGLLKPEGVLFNTTL